MTNEPWYLTVEPREPDEREAAVLRFLVGHDFPGAETLRADLDGLRVRPSCGCGCPSIALIPSGIDPTRTSSGDGRPAPLEITILPSVGRPAGGMILWIADGHLADLEVYAIDDPPPKDMPAVQHLEVTVDP